MRIVAETTDTGTTAEPAFDLSILSDAELLEAWIRDGQRLVLSTLVRRYGVLVLSVCRRRCRSDADADDAFPTTFL